MKKEIIFVSQYTADRLYKDIASHMDNNPLVITRFDIKTGSRISTVHGNNLSSLIPMNIAEYFFITDKSIHDTNYIDPVYFTAFILAHADQSLNPLAEKAQTEMAIILFEFLIHPSAFYEHRIEKVI